MRQSSTTLGDAAIGPWRQDVLHIDGLTVRSQVGGQGPHVLLLHGWGGAIESFAPVLDDLQRSYTVAAFDLPGFGNSSLPPTTWGSADYARLTLQIMERSATEPTPPDRPFVRRAGVHPAGGDRARTCWQAGPGV